MHRKASIKKYKAVLCIDIESTIRIEAAEIAKEAIKTGESVRKLIIETGLLTKEQMDEIMDPVQMTEPGISGKTVNKI